MPFINPYIGQVENHRKIIYKSEDIVAHKGKWNKFFDAPNQPLCLEIGTGLGNFFSSVANRHPQKNFVGMEIKYKRLIKTAEKTEKYGRQDYVLIKEYAEKLENIFAPEELNEIYILFPDPWPKKKHWKNRLIQTEYLQTLHNVLKPGGEVIFKTDDTPYYEWVKEICEQSDLFDFEYHVTDSYQDEFFEDDNIETEFEHIWKMKQKQLHYVRMIKK